jgi:hypothetical protein
MEGQLALFQIEHTTVVPAALYRLLSHSVQNKKPRNRLRGVCFSETVLVVIHLQNMPRHRPAFHEAQRIALGNMLGHE